MVLCGKYLKLVIIAFTTLKGPLRSPVAFWVFSELMDICVYLCQETEGILDFLPGERLKFITVTIADNTVPELDKSFRVELYNVEGGGTSLTEPLAFECCGISRNRTADWIKCPLSLPVPTPLIG